MKLASALAEEAVRLLRQESGPLARAVGHSSFFEALSPHVPAGKTHQYTLKLPDNAGRMARVMHYGVQPMFLGKTIADTKSHIDDLKAIRPEKLEAAGLDPEVASHLYRTARNRVLGRAAGDAVSWGLYPLAISNPAIHYPVVVGGAFVAPRLGEYAAKQLS